MAELEYEPIEYSLTEKVKFAKMMRNMIDRMYNHDLAESMYKALAAFICSDKPINRSNKLSGLSNNIESMIKLLEEKAIDEKAEFDRQVREEVSRIMNLNPQEVFAEDMKRHASL